MVMSESEAVSRYREGIERIGIDAYRRASNANTVTEAAEALENAKDNNMDAGDFASAYRNRY